MSIAKPKAFWPLTITTANQKVYLNHGGATSASITPGVYLSAATLCTEIATRLNALALGTTFGCSVDSSTGRITIAGIGSAFTLNWADVTTNTAALVLGWTLVNTSSSTSHVAPNQHQNGWYSNVAVRRDSLNFFDRKMDRVTVAVSGQNKRISEAEVTKRNFVFAFLSPWKALIERETSSGANTNEAIERMWRNGASKFRYWADQTVEGTSADYFLDEESVTDFAPERMYDSKELYQVEFKARLYV